ncbi:hypothetical protein LCGC14_0067630 [marine sediment metagenome]|uniref:Uncharacterized protein n=1 Tax=marine sediment metagenome TaxID=412755 RepID=A0A0F9YNU7_9ZZZZ|nr:hypothetical protein [Maribacter sp.]HDZ05532.1 hypothetical protein [Maribacter sp.]HEA81666.1 hypothetical protein [Maribacter sp.]
MRFISTFFIIAFLFYSSRITSQVTTNKYEVAVNEVIKTNDPKYYTGLIKILDDYQKELITRNSIADTTYNNYIHLLTQISRDSTYEINSNYTIGDSVQKLAKRFSYDGLKQMKTIPLSRYIQNNEAKSILLNQKAGQVYKNKGSISRADYAQLLLDVYDENDFQLPTIRLQLFRFIDPNSDGVFYMHVGKPTQK